MSSNEKFEREFEAFLNEKESRAAALYRKLPQVEPDARLDAAVRAMAHRALNPQLVATPRSTERRRRARWVPALGAAAGLVLAAGIAYRLGPSLHNDNEYAPAKDVISVRQLDTPAPAAEPPLSPPPPSAQREAPAPAALTRAPAGKLQSAPGTDLAPAPAAKAADLRAKEETQSEPAQNAADTGSMSKASTLAKPASAPQAFPAPAKAQKRAAEMDAIERKQIMAEGAWQNLHDRDADEAAHSEQKLKSLDDKAAENVAAPASAAAEAASAPHAAAAAANVPAAPPPPAAAGAAAAEAQIRMRSASPPADATVPEARSDAARPAPSGSAIGGRAPAAAPKADQPATPQRARSTDPNAGLYPEHWLANIRKMVQDGRRDDAMRSLGEFRRLYPDYQLPDDLRDLK